MLLFARSPMTSIVCRQGCTCIRCRAVIADMQVPTPMPAAAQLPMASPTHATAPSSSPSQVSRSSSSVAAPAPAPVPVPAPAQECPLSLLMRSFLRVITSQCPRQQHQANVQQLQSSLHDRTLPPLPKGALVEDLGDWNASGLEALGPGAILASVLPVSSENVDHSMPATMNGAPSSASSLSPSLPSSASSAASSASRSIDSCHRRHTSRLHHDPTVSSGDSHRSESSLSSSSFLSSSSSSLATSTAAFASLPLPVPVDSRPPIASSSHLFQDTLKRCGLNPSYASQRHASLQPTNILTLLRKRECHDPSSPSSCSTTARRSPLASHPLPQSLRMNMTMRRIPDWMRQIHHYESRVFSAQFSHAGDMLAVATQDQHIRLYEVESNSNSASTSSADDEYLFDSRPVDGGDDEMDDVPALRTAGTPHRNPNSSSFVPSTPFGSAGWRCVKDVHARHVGWAIVDTDWSPDDRFIAYSTWSSKLHLVSTQPSSASSSSQLCLQYPTLHEPLDLGSHATRFCVFSLKFSSDCKTILAGSSDRHVYLYDLVSHRKLTSFQGHCADINGVTWVDSDRGIVATGSDDCLVKLWDLRCIGGDSGSGSGRPTPIGCFVGHTQGITSLSSRGDGRHILTNSKDQTAKIWDIRRTCPLKDAAEKIPCEGQWDYRWARFQPKASSSPPPSTANQTDVKQQAQQSISSVATARATLHSSSSSSSTTTAASSASPCPVTAARQAACSLLTAILPTCNRSSNSPAATASAAACGPSPNSNSVDSSSSSLQSLCPSSSSSTRTVASSQLHPSCRSSDLSLMTFTGHRVLETLIRAYWSPIETTGQRYIYSGSQNGVIHIWDVLTGEIVKKLHGHYCKLINSNILSGVPCVTQHSSAHSCSIALFLYLFVCFVFRHRP